MATSNMLPVSNVAGNNQTSPGVGSALGRPTPIFSTTPSGTGTLPSGNPFLSQAPTTTNTTGAVPGTGLYNTASSQSSGQTDISKQLQDIAGKGIGGSLNQLLSSLSGVDSQVFQQWLQAQAPANAVAQATLNQGLGAAGIGAGGSVQALAESNLASNEAATAAQENANLMTQNIGTTSQVLQGMEGLASQEVASSGWQVLGNVLGQVGSDAATALGGTDLNKLFGG